jgi:uncharacterized protein (DUF58 family)
LLLLMDTNASMRFGTQQRFKSVQAARAAALAAWCASHADERVGAMAFGACREVQPARQGQRGALAVIGALARWDATMALRAKDDETLADALRRARQAARASSRVLIISDGLSSSEDARAGLLQMRRHAEVAVLIVADPLELGLPPAGRYALEHEGAHTIADLYGRAQREAFQRSLGVGAVRLAGLARQLTLRHRCIDTRDDPWEAVNDLLGRRERGKA